MKRSVRRRRIGLLSLVLIAVAGIAVALVVFAGTNDAQFTATGYSDVIRFQAEGVATLQVQIFDLSGKAVWDSGVVSGDTIDWDRNNDLGERLAYGAYIYSAQGWNAQGNLNFQKNGKLALMPGDKVQLQQAPMVDNSTLAPFEDMSLSPKETRATGHSASHIHERLKDHVISGSPGPSCSPDWSRHHSNPTPPPETNLFCGN